MKTCAKKIWPIVRKSRVLRTLVLLAVAFIVIALTLLYIGKSYGREAQGRKAEIQSDELMLQKLKAMAKAGQEYAVQKEYFDKKSFAGFEEVIPFIAYLEKLLSPIDPEAQITIKSPEGQIYMDHFADYSIQFKIKPEARGILYRALDQIYLSRFIVKPLSFTLYYNPNEQTERNDLDEVLMILRLYLK